MKKLYCSRDSVSGTWQDPQAFICDRDAERSFNFALANASIPDCFAKDIDLYCIGSFDETTGHVISSEPVHIVNGFNDDMIYIRDWIYKLNKEGDSDEISKET